MYMDYIQLFAKNKKKQLGDLIQTIMIYIYGIWMKFGIENVPC